MSMTLYRSDRSRMRASTSSDISLMSEIVFRTNFKSSRLSGLISRSSDLSYEKKWKHDYSNIFFCDRKKVREILNDIFVY